MLNLKEIRNYFSDKKWNKKEIAREIGIGYQVFLYTLKAGTNPPYYNVEKISKYIESQITKSFIEKNNPYIKVGE